MLTNSQIFRPTQLSVYYNSVTCFDPLFGPSSGDRIKTFHKGKRTKMCISFFLVMDGLFDSCKQNGMATFKLNAVFVNY